MDSNPTTVFFMPYWKSRPLTHILILLVHGQSQVPLLIVQYSIFSLTWGWLMRKDRGQQSGVLTLACGLTHMTLVQKRWLWSWLRTPAPAFDCADVLGQCFDRKLSVNKLPERKLLTVTILKVIPLPPESLQTLKSESFPTIKLWVNVITSG